MNRVIKTTSKNRASMVINALGSIFAFELISPSKEIFIISPWITNISILPNDVNQFRSFFTCENESDGRLATILNILSRRGTTIHILTRKDDQIRYTKEFVLQLAPEIKVRYADRLHEKILLTDSFFFRGSMNFTYSGAYINDEHVEMSADSQDIAIALTSAKYRWEEWS